MRPLRGADQLQSPRNSPNKRGWAEVNERNPFAALIDGALIYLP